MTDLIHNRIIEDLQQKVENLQLERNYAYEFVARLVRDVKPLMDCLRVDVREFDPIADPKQFDRSKLFGVLDMAMVEGSRLPSADAIRRVVQVMKEQNILVSDPALKGTSLETPES